MALKILNKLLKQQKVPMTKTWMMQTINRLSKLMKTMNKRLPRKMISKMQMMMLLQLKLRKWMFKTTLRMMTKRMKMMMKTSELPMINLMRM